MGSERQRHNAPSSAPAFDQFAARALPGLLRTAFLLTGDRGHAEDLVQTALVRMLRRWQVIDESPDAYALRVLVNLSRDRRRNLSRRLTEVPADRAPELTATDDVGRWLEHDAIISAVRALPRRQREVLTLRYFLDLSIADTAATLGFSDGAVKAYTSRALTSMRNLLTEQPAIQTHARREAGNAD